jgi:hypothetical protein
VAATKGFRLFWENPEKTVSGEETDEFVPPDVAK